MAETYKIIIQVKPGTLPNVSSSISAKGISITGSNINLNFIYAVATREQVIDISIIPGIVKVFYDEPVGIL